MMKRTSLLAALSLIFLAACGNGEKNAAAEKDALSPAKPLPAETAKAKAATEPAGWESAAKEASKDVAKKVSSAAEKAEESVAKVAADVESRTMDAANLVANMTAAKKKARQSVDADAVIKAIKETTNSVALIQLVTPLSYTTTRGPVVRGIFRDLLKNPDPDVREQTLMALEDYEGVAFMLDDMALMLEDEDEDVRDSAMTTIADYVDNRAKYEVLMKALDSKYPDVVEEAMFNLGFYTDVDFPTVQEWKDWWAKNKDTFKAD